MKALATFFVMALLLSGSAWAQSSASPTTTAGTVVATFSAKATSSGTTIGDELVVWVVSGGEARFQVSDKPSTVSTGAAGEASAHDGIQRGYATVGTSVKVIVGNYILAYKATGTNFNPTLALESVQLWTGTVK